MNQVYRYSYENHVLKISSVSNYKYAILKYNKNGDFLKMLAISKTEKIIKLRFLYFTKNYRKFKRTPYVCKEKDTYNNPDLLKIVEVDCKCIDEI